MNLSYGSYKNLTDSGAVTTNPGSLIGFYVNSTNAGTVALVDGGSGGTAITGTITPAIGWHFLPVSFGKSGGLYFTKGGTSINVTFIYQPAG